MIFEISLITYGESLNKYSEIKRHLTQMDKVAVQSIIRERKKKAPESRMYLVGLCDGAQRMHITPNSINASKVQKAGMIQALRHSSLKGSVALKYN